MSNSEEVRKLTKRNHRLVTKFHSMTEIHESFVAHHVFFTEAISCAIRGEEYSLRAEFPNIFGDSDSALVDAVLQLARESRTEISAAEVSREG